MSSDSLEDDADLEEAMFTRRSKKDFSKYKKTSLRCFNCGKFGHFAAKCPYEDNEDNNSERKSNSIRRSIEERQEDLEI